MTPSPKGTTTVLSSEAAARLSMQADQLGQLVIQDAQGNRFENVRPVRLFPLSRPDQWISLVDQQGREIACIEDLTQLSIPNQSLLRAELEQREFVPIVKRVLWVSGNSEPCQWKVETDRGLASFILKDEKDVRRLGPHGVLVVDSFGIRYYIPDRNQLDTYSQRIIEWYV
ncbi:MAG: DUF1854 domain-containing protein [Pirellulaceae bacterium]|nr:DUF1854 domain-containing protein [Pirellulaceae bacterium]